MAEDAPKATVLVVDDNADNVELVRMGLESAGYEVVAAYDGEEALLKVADASPDVILLDVMMPGLDGIEVCRRLKSWEETRSIPVLMLTALKEVEDRVRAIEVGADEFLSKPVDMTELKVRVKALVRTHHYHRQLVDKSRQLAEKTALLEKVLNLYLAEQVVDEVLRDPARLQLGGARRAVTVLFADLSGFTAYAESVPPEAVMETLNRTFSRLTTIVRDHHGTFDKYVGDCLMAFYGAPVSAGNDALNAVRSATAMQEAFQALRAEWGDGPSARLCLSIGLNSGEALVGNMGSERLMNYTVIGDVVNVAARLEGLAGPGQVLMGEATHALVADVVVARKFAETELRGRAGRMAVYELVRVMSPRVSD